MKKVLVLGSGMVAPPLVKYLVEHGFSLTVASMEFTSPEATSASRTASAIRKLLDERGGRAVAFDMDAEAVYLDALVAECDLAVSLLPAPRHPLVAEACLRHRKHLVTTSYISPAMRRLDAESRKLGLLFLNEIGVDPGIDHMSAMQVVEQETARGNRLVGFVSWCGGLPAPEANDNPFGYKFSWSPKGVLTAARNGACFRRGGRLVEIPAEKLFTDPALVEIPGVGAFEGYPNRDSLSYIETYGFDPDIEEMFRGTLRNLGHCELYRGLIDLGLLQDAPRQDFSGMKYADVMEKLVGRPVKGNIRKRLGARAARRLIEALEYIGMFSGEEVKPAQGSIMDVMAARMADKLAYRPGERDMLLMRHDMTFERPDKKRERITALMVDFGQPDGDSSMARTVSLPAAIGVRLILEGKISLRGVRAPVQQEIYRPVLRELQEMNIGFRETRTVL